MITCPSCNHQNEVGSSFCENCGHDLREMIPLPPTPPTPSTTSGVICSNCMHSNIPGAAFCENCGTKLGQVVPPVVSESVPRLVSEAPAMDQLNCSNCGHENIPGSIFCENCGNPLDQEIPESLVEEPQDESDEKPPEATSLEEIICSICGASNPDGTNYCGNCGSMLRPPTSPPAFKAPVEEAPSESPKIIQITGKLVLPISGASIDVPNGLTEVFIGREDPISGIFPDIDLDPHGGHDGGVGRRHARLFLQGSQLMIEDLDSVNGTVVNKQKLSPNQPHPVPDGAELRFGKIVAIYHAS